MSFKYSTLATTGALALALPTWAHHSHGNYEKEFIDLEGVVTEMHLINPHSWVFMEVTDDKGQKTEWGLEASHRGDLEKIGVTYDYIGPGDTIKVRCHPLRNGAPECLLGFLQGRDRIVKDWDNSGAMPVDDGFFDLE